MMKIKPELIYNDDSDTLRRIPPPHTTEKIVRAVDYLKESQVDCLVWCIGEMQAYSYPAEKVESVFDKLDTLDSVHSPRKNDLMYNLYKKGVDYLPLLIRECRKAKLSFVAGFRMNDTHLKSNPRGILASRFWQEHQHYRLWEITDGKTYYNACLDYSFPEVRKLYLDMIEEVAERYDVDGIELDFCRNPYLFQPEAQAYFPGLSVVFVIKCSFAVIAVAVDPGLGYFHLYSLILVARVSANGAGFLCHPGLG